MKKHILFIMLLFVSFAFSQTKSREAREKENKELLSKAQASLEKGNLPLAEAKYRRVITNDPNNTEAKYNLGNLYYEMGKNGEAGRRYVQAAEAAETKTEKHKIYHNLGNVLMNEKEYRAAVEAYKNALRNDPTDDETRYNLALAKLMLEEHGDEGGGSDDDQQEEDKDEEQEGDSQEEQDQGNQDDDNQDKGDEGDDEQSAPEQSDEGDPKGEDDSDSPEEIQPREGRLSPQQIQSLLEAMNNEERKVQDKINAERQQGVRVNPEKDW